MTPVVGATGAFAGVRINRGVTGVCNNPDPHGRVPTSPTSQTDALASLQDYALAMTGQKDVEAVGKPTGTEPHYSPFMHNALIFTAAALGST